MKVPNYYQEIEPIPGEIENTKIYGFVNNDYQCLIKVFPVDKKCLMPLNCELIIDGIHDCLDNDQGLIECDFGSTNKGINYIYSIIKTALKPSGVQYFLRLQLNNGDDSTEFNIFADELGVTGSRDSMVYALLKIKDPKDWRKDPYDPNYKKGNLMNLSEDKMYDEAFPNHPLSEIRRLITFIEKNY